MWPNYSNFCPHRCCCMHVQCAFMRLPSSLSRSRRHMCLVYAFLFVVLESFIHLIELQAKRHKPIEINRSIKYSSSFFYGMDCIDLNLYTSISTLVELKGGQMDISFCTLFVHMCIFIMNGKKTTNDGKKNYI